MDNFIRSGVLLLCAVATMYCGSAIAGVTEGIAAMVKRDYVTALRELRPAAERGDAEAQYRLGRMYEFGQGVPVDKAQAMTWFLKSVAQGNASAQLELGVIYATGDGVAQDDVQAVEWFRKAAVQGNATAQLDLVRCEAAGKGMLPRE